MSSPNSPPGLRKRQLTPDLAAAKSSNDTSSPSHHLHVPRRQTYLLVLLSVATTVFFLSWSATHVSHPPTTYALCTRAGGYIYTMDEGKPIAQCLVVQDTKFVDVGSQGWFLFSNGPPQWSTTDVVHIRRSSSAVGSFRG